MLETGHARRSQEFEKLLEKCSVYAQPLIIFFVIDLTQIRELAVSKNINFFYCSYKYLLGKAGATV